MAMRRSRGRVKTYVIGIAIPLVLGGLSGWISNSSAGFSSLVKPPLTPPAIVFPIVWTVLYLLMGISSIKVYLSRYSRRAQALNTYAVQLLMNVLWPILFFCFGRTLLAFFWLVALLLLVLVMIIRFRQANKTAGNLNIPYLLWLLFAGYLNLAIYFLNR